VSQKRREGESVLDDSSIFLLLTWQSGDTSNLGLSGLVPVRSGGEWMFWASRSSHASLNWEEGRFIFWNGAHG
jgi:hypothetical protein